MLARVYRIAHDELKLASSDGWVKVSNIGTIVRDRFPKHDPSTYKGEKHSKLTKVIAKMAHDYPRVVEVKQMGTIHYLRVKK